MQSLIVGITGDLTTCEAKFGLFSLQSSGKIVFLQNKWITANEQDAKTQRTTAGVLVS